MAGLICFYIHRDRWINQANQAFTGGWRIRITYYTLCAMERSFNKDNPANLPTIRMATITHASLHRIICISLCCKIYV